MWFGAAVNRVLTENALVLRVFEMHLKPGPTHWAFGLASSQSTIMINLTWSLVLSLVYQFEFNYSGPWCSTALKSNASLLYYFMAHLLLLTAAFQCLKSQSLKQSLCWLYGTDVPLEEKESQLCWWIPSFDHRVRFHQQWTEQGSIWSGQRPVGFCQTSSAVCCRLEYGWSELKKKVW